ncbi:MULTISPECIES: YgaP family membrane protein [unclassified Croceitalea]|uniref:YgaP family membrane protein n=1 Tax=unclassified Croceitalea TaxID=2632280 RepID=UPI0030DD39C3
MKRNMGNADRTIRFLVAILFGVLYYNGTISGTWGIVLVVVAVVFALTSFAGFCPLYAPFGIKTCSTKRK